MIQNNIANTNIRNFTTIVLGDNSFTILKFKQYKVILKNTNSEPEIKTRVNKQNQRNGQNHTVIKPIKCTGRATNSRTNLNHQKKC